jgi:OOP family OmpA-OmpF porin
MTRRHSLRIAALAAAVSLNALLAASGHAQSVRMFEDAPSLEQLRSILIPETKPGGLSRRIEIPRRETLAGEPVARQASAEQAAPSRTIVLPPPTLRSEPEAPPAPVVAPASTPRDAAFESSAQPSAAPRQVAAAIRPAPRAEEASPPTGDAVGFRINFALNSAVVPAPYEPHIDRIGELMRQEPELKLMVEGHTDALGSDQYNVELSERRAVSVARYLVVRHGIEPDRLRIAGKGKTEPLLANPYNPRNRRVQFLRAE